MIIHNPILTGSFTVNGTDVASITSSAASITAINSYTASQNILNGTYATTGSNTFKNPQTINSNLIVTGSITAQTLVVQTVSSSVIYSSGSNVFGNNIANTHIFTGSMYVTGAFYVSTGSVGIGTVSPSQKLEVVGGEIKAGRVDSSQEGGQVSFGRASDNNTSWYIDLYGSSTSPQLRFVDVDNSAVRMTLTGSNVGIGTSSPSFILSFGGDTARTIGMNQSTLGTAPALTLKGADSTTGTNNEGGAVYISAGLGTGNGTTSNIIFSTAPSAGSGTTRQTLTERMRIASNGTITTSNAPSADWGMIINNLNTGAGNSYGLKVIAGTNSSDISFGVVNAANTFYYLRLNGNGHLKLANFSTTFSGNYHQIQNDISGDWICQFGQNNASPYGIVLSYFNAAPRSAGAEMLYLTDSSGVVFKVSSNGNVYNLNNSYNALSDIKLKENITDATPKLDKLMRVRIVNFNLKTDPNTKQIGVIAQELQEVFPGLIEENYDRGSDNKLNGETTLGVKYSVFVPMLIKAVQELKATNDDLQAQITELKNK